MTLLSMGTGGPEIANSRDRMPVPSTVMVAALTSHGVNAQNIANMQNILNQFLILKRLWNCPVKSRSSVLPDHIDR